jgi:hypothetical protein
MILDPAWMVHPGEAKPLLDDVMEQVGVICGNAFSTNIDDLDQVANAIDEALIQVGSLDDADVVTIIRLASQALKSIGETKAGTRLFLFGAGVIKPLKWDVAGEDTLWALDVDYIMMGNPVDCELLIFPTLNVILASICDLWDESGGQGMLGLLHTRRALRSSLQIGLKQGCEAWLKRTSLERQWSSTPQVINLDMENGASKKQRMHRHKA